MPDRKGILVDGQIVDCSAPVLLPAETGLEFRARRHREVTLWILNHWTGSENPVPLVVRNMTARHVSVHFIVDARGLIYQTADAMARCSHCPVANDEAVGIEYVNRGHDLELPARGVDRVRVTEVVHGARVTYGLMTPAQVVSAVALNMALCRAFDLPMQVPLDAATHKPYPTVLPPRYLARFRGSAGHYHFDRGKVDPAIDLLRRLQLAFEGGRTVA